MQNTLIMYLKLIISILQLPQGQRTNSPWSSKTKDILDSCLGFSDFEIEKLDLYINSKDSKSYAPLYDQMTEIYLSSSNVIRKYLNSPFVLRKIILKKLQ